MMKAKDIISIVCIGIIVRLLSGIFFDEYGILSYQRLASYEKILAGNLRELERISRRLEQDSAHDPFVDAAELSLLRDHDVLVHVEHNTERPSVKIGTLYIVPPSPLVLRKILRTVSLSSVMISFVILLLHRFFKKRSEIEPETQVYRGLTSR